MGRYALHAEIAAGGMATVHFGRLIGPAGFARTVAIKRLHPAFARDPEFVAMLLDEARLASRIRHPNVVPTLDVVASSGELFVVLEYVQGESLARLMRAWNDLGERLPLPVVSSIVTGVLHGLHAAHEAKSERGDPLGIVHRDVSPQNVLVGVDGVPRILDFGIAKASNRVQTTREGQLKGKLAYMAPEQFSAGTVSRQADIWAAAVVLWEALTGERLFAGRGEMETFAKVVTDPIPPPSTLTPGLPPEIDAIVLRGLSRDVHQRYQTAREMALDVERCLGIASPTQVGTWVERAAHSVLAERAERIAELERDTEPHAERPRPASAPTVVEGAPVPPLPRPPNLPSEPATLVGNSSSITATTFGLPKPHRRLKIAVAALLLLGASGVAIFTLAGKSAKPTLAATTADPTGAGASPPPSVSVPPPSPLASVSARLADAADRASATATAPRPTPPPVDPNAGRTAGAPTRTVAATAATTAPTTRPTATATAPPPRNCSPPYTLDQNGVKRWKPECL